MNVNFVGNLTPNPQTIFLLTPEDCEATPEALAELLSNALNDWLAGKADVIENLEGFEITAVPDSISFSVRSGSSDCEVAFSGPIIES